MKPNALKTVMIRSAVEKGIKDIKDDPKRGIRNLVELGEMFAGGRFQKDFFKTTMVQLRDENSAYYRIVEQVARQADADALTSFGINLGYNALAHGASIIRDIEATEGYNIPWCITIDVGYETTMLPFDIEGLIEEGKELGIYCYLIYVDSAYPYFDDLMNLLAREKECAFVIFCHPNMVDDSFTENLEAARHVAVFLDLDCNEDDLLVKTSQDLLSTGNICGGFTRAENLAAEDVTSALLDLPESLELPLTAYVRIKKHHPTEQDDVYQKFVQLRESLDVAVLPIDLYQDMAHADRAISSEACLVAVMGDGSLALADMEANERVTGFNIHNISLSEALRKAMPKRGTKENLAHA